MKYFHKKSIKVPLYGGNLVLMFTNNKREIVKHIPDFDRENIYAHSCGMNDGGKEGYVIILNFNLKDSKISHGRITHEVVHIVSHIAETRGFEPSFSNDEPIAYLADWVANEVYKFMSEKGFSCN